MAHFFQDLHKLFALIILFAPDTEEDMWIKTILGNFGLLNTKVDILAGQCLHQTLIIWVTQTE